MYIVKGQGETDPTCRPGKKRSGLQADSASEFWIFMHAGDLVWELAVVGASEGDTLKAESAREIMAFNRHMYTRMYVAKKDKERVVLVVHVNKCHFHAGQWFVRFGGGGPIP